MNRTSQIALAAGILTLATTAFACIIPDRDIVVITKHPCGQEWTVSAVGAYGYDINGYLVDITNDQDRWLAKTYCLNDALSEQLEDPTSDLHYELIDDITQLCQARTLELGIADLDDSCISTVGIGYIGHCYPPAGGCDGGTDEGETGGGETGSDSGNLGDFTDLDLATEISFEGGEYVVSQHLIDVALSDPVGVSNDGTTPIQVTDASGRPYGFEITGARSDNLGGLLGLRDGDVVTSVASQPTATYEDLLELAAVLLAAERAAIVIERTGKLMTLHIRRGR